MTMVFKTFVVALIDLGLVLFLTRRITPERFRHLKWALAAASAIGWGIFATVLLWVAWGWYYRHFFSNWARWVVPLEALLLYGLVGLGFWWLATRLPGHPVVNFCLLGGLESVPEHVLAIYRLRILDRVPVLRGESPASVLVFAAFEYIFYWGVALSMAVLLQNSWQRWARGR